MVALAERMLNLQRKLAGAAVSADRAPYRLQVASTGRCQIDALAGELYACTDGRGNQAGRP
jgi:hypothetical protein